MADAFLAARYEFQRARQTAVRDRRTPVVMPRVVVGHLPDPRVAPTPRPPFHKSLAGSALIGFAGLVVFTALIWTAALWVMP